MGDYEEMIEALSSLSQEQVREVLDYIGRLKSNGSDAKPGSVDAVQRAVGSWWMNPEETEAFLREIDETRAVGEPDRDLPPEYQPRRRPAE